MTKIQVEIETNQRTTTTIYRKLQNVKVYKKPKNPLLTHEAFVRYNKQIIQVFCYNGFWIDKPTLDQKEYRRKAARGY